MKYRLKASCLYFHINSLGKGETLNCDFKEKIWDFTTKSIELLQFWVEDVFLPKGRWMSLPPKPIRARSKMARGDAAGRAGRGCPSILCCVPSSAGWGTSTDICILWHYPSREACACLGIKWKMIKSLYAASSF